MAKTVELLGANTESIRLSGAEARTSIALDPAALEQVVNQPERGSQNVSGP